MYTWLQSPWSVKVNDTNLLLFLVCSCHSKPSENVLIKRFKRNNWHQYILNNCGFLSCVNSHVLRSVTWWPEWHGTFRTTEGFLSSVNSFMTFQALEPCEWLGTFWTTEGFLSSMNCYMSLQIGKLWEWLGTIWTTERFLSGVKS